MKALHANVLMLCAAIGLSHVLVLTGLVFPALYAGSYGIASLAEADALLLAPARFATHHFWVFPVLLASSCVAFVGAISGRRAEVAELLTCGLCVQGLVVWSAAFCFCFGAFTGPMCLHHGPRFQVGTFLTACFGAFPVTLAALLAPIAVVLYPKVLRKGRGDSEPVDGERLGSADAPPSPLS